MQETVLTSEIIESFSELFLVKRYDGSLSVPAIHREWWDICCGPERRVAIAAPRGHAKTTAITLAYTLASILFRIKRYIIVVGNNEDTAIELLAMIRNELKLNDSLKEVFKVKSKWSKDLQTEIIVEFEDGHKARLLAKGAGQKVRGRNWNGTRPDLIVVDDLEDDEAVENDDRRRKLKGWFKKALIPSLSRARGQIRFIGTILHEDSLLMNAINSSAWAGKLYKAHRAFDDFSDLLWPEMWPEEALREERQSFIDDGDPEGYSQEYLNDPSDLRHAFFRSEDFLPMDESDHNKIKTFYIGGDFSLSDKSYSDYTAFIVGGYDEQGILHIVDAVRIKTDDSNEILEVLFNLLETYQPEYCIWEKGMMANAIGPPLMIEMQRRNIYTHVETFNADQDKRKRAVPIQQRMRAKAVRFNIEAEWYPPFREELRRFPRGKKKDQVDAFAWLGRGIAEFVEAPTQEQIEEEDWEFEYEQSGLIELEYTGTGY